MNFWLIKSNSTEEINTKDPIKRDIVAAGAAGAMIRFRPISLACSLRQ